MQTDDIMSTLTQGLTDSVHGLQPFLDKALTPPGLWLTYGVAAGVALSLLCLVTSRPSSRRASNTLVAATHRLAHADRDLRNTRDRPLPSPGDIRNLVLHPSAQPTAPRPAARLSQAARKTKPALALLDRHRSAIALATPGDRIGDNDRLKGLAEAEAAGRKAVQLIDPDTSPQPWAIAMYHLAMILSAQAARLDGEPGLQKLLEAQAVMTKALQACNRETAPQDWATIQNGLGDILRDLGDRLDGDRLPYYEAAITAFRNALLIVTYKGQRRNWAIIQRNLAETLDASSGFLEREAALQRLTEAEDAFRNALRVFSIMQTPGVWAYLHYRLAVVLTDLAHGTGKREKLKQAERAYRQVLRVNIRKDNPVTWAEIQLSLAEILADLADDNDGAAGVKRLKQAAHACRRALQVFTRQADSLNWGFAHLSLATILYELGRRGDGHRSLNHLREAERAGDAALQIVTQETMPVKWSGLHRLMGLIKLEQSLHLRGKHGMQALNDAERHCVRALSACSRDDQPLPWAWCHTTLALVLYEFGLRLRGRDGLEKLQLAEQAGLRALEVWTPESFPDTHNLIQKLLNMVRAAMTRRPTGA